MLNVPCFIGSIYFNRLKTGVASNVSHFINGETKAPKKIKALPQVHTGVN